MGKNIELQQLLIDEAATIAFGGKLAAALPATGAFAIALAGPLGAGKSTLARATLRRLGVTGPVPSPTYTLVEPYRCARGSLYHVDLYRLKVEADMEDLGLDEALAEGALLLVEWPERGAAGVLSFDLAIDLAHAGQGRELRARALTPAGGEVLSHLQEAA